jgi:hypothetical protein
MLGAAACYGLSSFVVKGSYGHLASMQTSFVSISVASVVTLPLALATLPGAMPGLRAVAAVVALGAVGTALAFVIFYKLINEVGAGRASLVSYLAPGVALFYGALLLDEAITVAAVVGLVAILAASRSRRAAALAPGLPGGGGHFHALREAEPVARVVAEGRLDAVEALRRLLDERHALLLELAVRGPAVAGLEHPGAERALGDELLHHLGRLGVEHRRAGIREDDLHVGLVGRPDVSQRNVSMFGVRADLEAELGRVEVQGLVLVEDPYAGVGDLEMVIRPS